MRLTTLLLLATCLHVSASGLSQKVTFSFRNVSLSEVIREIGAQTGVSIICNRNQLKAASPVTLTLQDVPLDEALVAVLKNQPFSFEMKEGRIVIRKTGTAGAVMNAAVAALSPPDTLRIYGHVLDEAGKPLPGASVNIKGTKTTFLTNPSGAVILKYAGGNITLVISSLGYEDQEVNIGPKDARVFTVRLKIKVNELATLEINTGMFTRKKESFTGAVTSFSGDQLKTVGNRNVLQSLKTLDPSFVMLENNLQGSNPNNLPSIEIRGKTTVNISSTTSVNDQFSGDPNQPLFILDGFETTLQAIYDLDMNRVASITLLKDAASTAIYGSKAANGVVVVETKKPVAGELRLNFSSDYSFDIPDFRSYNLMNSAEKLQFEKLAGVYNAVYGDVNSQWRGDSLYNARLTDVQRGVNTYWLKEPVHTGVSQRYSLRASGGSNELLFSAGVNYQKQGGVMKGSDRNNWGGQFDLTYRKNKLNLTNSLTVSNLNSDESPYGSFSNFSRASPYYRKYNADGSIPMYMEPNATDRPNPLYNASLFSINHTNSFQFRDNLQGIYSLSNNFRITGGVSLSKGISTMTRFIPPDNTQFNSVDPFLKGSYTKAQTENNSYGANLMVSYAKTFGRSQLNANVRGDVSQTSTTATSFAAVGFPYGTNGNPVYAYSYPTSGRPSSSAVKARSVGVLGSVNYAFDQRFLVDATYRLDGASNFGSNKQFQPFSSIGAGWNISREAFLKNYKWISLLKIRGNVGYTGNQNIGTFTSTSVYTFFPGASPFGQALDMTSLGNPDLDWQNTLQQSYGADFSFFQNRISGSIEYYNKLTKPMLVSASGSLPTSTGVNSKYTVNVGQLKTTGYSFNVRFLPVSNAQKHIIWTVGITGQTSNSVYGALGSSLDVLNKLALAGNSLVRYRDGNSPDDIWTVVSHGIDPATGSEIFQQKDGKLTFTYNTNDIVKVGNTRPKIEGVINSSFTYKNLSFGANVRYRIGGYVFNGALYDKVENIDSKDLALNQDRRALYERWQKPGDMAQFKSISLNISTPMSSRFVQKDTHFVGESFNASWRMQNGWVHHLGLQSMSISFYVNDIFRIESIKTERGIDYPFARSVSASLNVSF
jgi:TonB-linked SusC/RagA family outer membrane protein